MSAAPADVDPRPAHSPSHWDTLSAVVELATEQTELITGRDVQFQPDQLAKHSETWLHSAGAHLIDSAKTRPDSVEKSASSSVIHQSQPRSANQDLSSKKSAADTTTDNKSASSATSPANRTRSAERFKPHTLYTPIIVKASKSSTVATASAPALTEQSEHVTCAHRSTLPQNSQLFQVWVGKQVALNLMDAEQAEAVAQKLRTVLAESTSLEPERFQLRLFQDQPAIYIKDALDGEPLLVVTDELAQAFSNDNTLLAIDWLNHLRKIFHGAPLDVAQIQADMYDLQETSRQIEGRASWYGPWFHGRLTATGEIFDKGELTAAHPSLPFDTYLKVTNLENNKSLIVRINDRGPYIENRNLDLSHRAAQCLGSEKSGVIPFKAIIMDAPVDIAAAE
ncbi:MAG: septal ring lytic transglycosylase RlpA family protein [Thainema sp.]